MLLMKSFKYGKYLASNLIYMKCISLQSSITLNLLYYSENVLILSQNSIKNYNKSTITVLELIIHNIYYHQNNKTGFKDVLFENS